MTAILRTGDPRLKPLDRHGPTIARISAEIAAFEPFVQLSGQPGENSGLGIGLTLVKRFVELHEGAVEAKSEGPGTGTTFTVELPTSSATESIAPDSSTRLPQTANPRRILVVDDNRDAAHSLGELLKLMGHEICIAYDGQQATELVRSAKPAGSCHLGHWYAVPEWL